MAEIDVPSGFNAVVVLLPNRDSEDAEIRFVGAGADDKNSPDMVLDAIGVLSGWQYDEAANAIQDLARAEQALEQAGIELPEGGDEEEDDGEPPATH